MIMKVQKTKLQNDHFFQEWTIKGDLFLIGDAKVQFWTPRDQIGVLKKNERINPFGYLQNFQ